MAGGGWGCKGSCPCERVGDACHKIGVKHLNESNLGMQV